MRCRAPILPLLLALLAAMPARAGLFDDQEARQRVEELRGELTELRKRTDEIEKQGEGRGRNQLDFANQLEEVKAELARLRGQAEVIAHELDAAQKRQKDFYVDLDSRLRKIESAQAPAAEAKPEAGAAPAKAADPAAEMRDYEAALTAFKGGKYKDALAGFEAFIKNHPASAMLPNAHYWAASSHYQLREFPKAAELFSKFAVTWPNDARTPDALLNQANAQFDAGDAKGGRKTLETLVEKYPSSEAAQAAKPRIKKKK